MKATLLRGTLVSATRLIHTRGRVGHSGCGTSNTGLHSLLINGLRWIGYPRSLLARGIATLPP